VGVLVQTTFPPSFFFFGNRSYLGVRAVLYWRACCYPSFTLRFFLRLLLAETHLAFPSSRHDRSTSSCRKTAFFFIPVVVPKRFHFLLTGPIFLFSKSLRCMPSSTSHGLHPRPGDLYPFSPLVICAPTPLREQLRFLAILTITLRTSGSL